jgi:hypothetical protein
MSTPANKYASRKFLLHAAALLIATVALFMDKLAGGEWSTVVIGLGGSYGISNAAWQYATHHNSPPRSDWPGGAG